MADYRKLKAAAQDAIDKEPGSPVHFLALQRLAKFADPTSVLALIAENERLKTMRSTTERDLTQELEVWKHGPSCWNCGDTGDVHDMVGEWRGQCDCLAAKLIDVTSERDQLKAEVEALHAKIDRLLAHCPEGECATCGEIICPHSGAMHFHHDGCPSCAEHEFIESKESGHD